MIYNFHGSYNLKEKKLFQLAQEEDLKKICKYLETNSNILSKIRFEIFDTREGKQEMDPHHSISRASARFKEMTIYRFWQPQDDPHFPHETTHLVTHTWAKPYIFETELDTWDNQKLKKSIDMVSTSFMQEGLAIAVDDIVFKRKLFEEGELKYVNDWCVEQIGNMPKNLVEVINLSGFGSLPNKIVVPFAASLAKFLLLKFGLDNYKNMYISLNENMTPKENVKKIEHIYKRPENELLNNWRNWVKD